MAAPSVPYPDPPVHMFLDPDPPIHMFLGLPDPDPLVRGMDPDPVPSIMKQ